MLFYEFCFLLRLICKVLGIDLKKNFFLLINKRNVTWSKIKYTWGYSYHFPYWYPYPSGAWGILTSEHNLKNDKIIYSDLVNIINLRNTMNSAPTYVIFDCLNMWPPSHPNPWGCLGHRTPWIRIGSSTIHPSNPENYTFDTNIGNFRYFSMWTRSPRGISNAHSTDCNSCVYQVWMKISRFYGVSGLCWKIHT